MYTDRNFTTKKAFREAVTKGEQVRLWQPGPFGGNEIPDGEHSVEGPHYPEPHRWYARASVKGGVVVKVK